MDICNSCSNVGLLLMGVVIMTSGDVDVLLNGDMEVLLYGVVIEDCNVLLYSSVLYSLIFLILVRIG